MITRGAVDLSQWKPQDVSNLHNMSDVDSGQLAQHHTLGLGPNQAAAGNHNHKFKSVSFAHNWPNVPITSLYSYYIRIGDYVSVKQGATLTAPVENDVLIDLPFELSASMYVGVGDAHLLGRCRAIRVGVAWYTGDITLMSTSGPPRAGIYLDNGSGTIWNPNSPATWAAGDRWAIEYSFVAASI